ncbi:MAG TPA: hypothetical protein VMV77_19705 [Bacteroidales bacterium]|nr:hypothetical protein [Bacteroidales bacterium]
MKNMKVDLFAAPDLYEACLVAKEYFEILKREYGKEHDCLKLLRAAIEKATITREVENEC